MAQKFELTFTPTRPGIATCRARNSEGSDESQAQVLIGDLDKPLQTWGVDEDPIAAGDPLTLTCGALVYTYAAELHWYLHGIPVESTDGNLFENYFLNYFVKRKILALFYSPVHTDVQVTTYNTEYSYRTNLTWQSVNTKDSGDYECKASVINSEVYDTSSLFVKVHGMYF